MEYLDFGSSSESEHDEDGEMMCAMDSDEEERHENNRLLQMFNLHEPPSKSQRKMQDFEAEMEAELDRRAFEVENQGGMEHQKSLSRSSSTASLNKSPRASPVPPGMSRSAQPKKSCLKRSSSCESAKGVKSVKFESTEGTSTQSTATPDSSGSTSHQEGNKKEETVEDKKAKEMYDELYFDSDESDGEGEVKASRKNKRRFMTNDELFYDPSMDAKDQEWIDDQRRKSYRESNKEVSLPHQPKPSSSSGGGTNNQPPENESSNGVKLPSTDAVLNCPACFTTVCHDCQRHELYVGQYRAMFVMNCLVNKQETLTVPEKPPKKFRKRGKASMPQFTHNSSSDVFHPVICRTCKTQVAMYDSDEVYHFFNVLASQP